MSAATVLHDFSNMGHQGPGRLFPGFRKPGAAVTYTLAPRGCQRLDLSAGDLLSIDQAQGLHLVALNDRGRDALPVLGLKATSTVPWLQVDGERLSGWVGAQGGDIADLRSYVLDSGETQVVLKTTGALTLWILHPLAQDSLITGALNDVARVIHQPVARGSAILPPPLGEIRDEFTVKRGTGMAYELKAGEIVQVIDVEGQQCSDFMALRADGLDRGEEWLIDSTATRSMVRRSFPGPGLLDKFFDREMRPLLNVVQDTCGRHDTFGLACTARGYEERGFRSCELFRQYQLCARPLRRAEPPRLAGDQFLLEHLDRPPFTSHPDRGEPFAPRRLCRHACNRGSGMRFNSLPG